jgi:tRNA U-34 5-methylaminomethyl-2-thiouridine biosynthesis protein MnmC
LVYDYIIIGAGVAGCCVAYELNKKTSNILLIEQNSSIASGASGAAGAFLSPLLGKPNEFKDLVNSALIYSTNFYKQNFNQYINNCGTLRIPKDDIAKQQFESYKPYIDFEYEEKNNGYFFPIASVVDSKDICETMVKDVNINFNTTINTIQYKDNIYLLEDKYKTKNIIITTGYCTRLIDENYFNIRAVWGQRIDIKTSTCISFNYHKACSVSASKFIDKNTNLVSIGATHHRFVKEKKTNKEDTQHLLDLANDIIKLDNVEVVKEIAGARASSVDYFPMVGEVVDSKMTLDKFPYIKKGSKVPIENYICYNNFYALNGLGGRGFVLAPYLAKILVQNLFDKKDIPTNIKPHRLFTRWARKQK